MARQIKNEIELNFDGLTDTLTNLVGTLILFVFLLLAVTYDVGSEKSPGILDPGIEPSGRKRSSQELSHELVRLQAELKKGEADVAREESELTALQARVAQLATKASPQKS